MLCGWPQSNDAPVTTIPSVCWSWHCPVSWRGLMVSKWQSRLITLAADRKHNCQSWQQRYEFSCPPTSANESEILGLKCNIKPRKKDSLFLSALWLTHVTMQHLTPALSFLDSDHLMMSYLCNVCLQSSWIIISKYYLALKLIRFNCRQRSSKDFRQNSRWLQFQAKLDNFSCFY